MDPAIQTPNAKSDLSGEWSVNVVQPLGKDMVDYDVACHMKQQGDNLEGKMKFDLSQSRFKDKLQLEQGEQFDIPFKGVLKNEELYIHYDNGNDEVSQYGSAILSIQQDGSLTGKFVGHSPENQGVMTGELTFTKA